MHRHHKFISEIVYALTQLNADLPLIQSGKPIIYYPDFNLIYPYIYRQTQDRYNITDTFGACLFTLNNYLNKPDNVHICISLPTAIEFLFSLQKNRQIYESTRRDSTFASYAYECMQKLTKGDINIDDIQSKKIKSFIVSIRNHHGLEARLAAFLDAIYSHKIDMLTDYYSSHKINEVLRERRPLLDALQIKMNNNRSPDDYRTEINKVIAFKADAHNIFLSILNEIDSSKNINFVCSNRFYHWAIEPILQAHQRQALFLIILIANLSNRQPGSTKATTISSFQSYLDKNLNEGKDLLQLSANYDLFDLGIDRRIEVYLEENIGYYLAMARKYASQQFETVGSLLDKEASYKDYLHMIDGRNSVVERSIKSVHELIDDTTDDMYRDFIDDDRIKAALPSLNIR